MRTTTAIAFNKRVVFTVTLFLIALSFVAVEKSNATALGLTDGNYDITITVPSVAIGTGQISIGPTSVTSFHVLFNNGVGAFDCGPTCTEGTLSPDLVAANTPTLFR